MGLWDGWLNLIYLEKRDVLMLFVFYSTYEVLVSILNYWNVDPGIQVDNAFLFDKVAWDEYQPESS